MSYHSYIGGEYIETTGGDSKIFSRENIEYNSGGVITTTSNEGHSFGEPSAMPPMEINNMYVKVRIKEPYNGEFGFDWIDVSPDDKKDIQKTQDVDFSNVEYFYKEGATENDLGDIVAKSTDENGAKNAVIKNYNFNNVCKYVDMPFVLIKPLQEITLTAEIILREGEIKEDEIKITGDDFYDFEIVGGTKEGKTSKIKITKVGKIDFKIKCLKEGSEKKYEFFHNNPTSPSMDVGGVVMMENKVLKLKFRVIALVSSDNSPSDKAKALFKKFKESKVREYLNENSLNQAGYEVEIENYNEMDNADVDDYFYAFDKEDWKRKELFKEQYNKKYWDKVLKNDGTYELEPDGKHYKMVLTDNPPKPIDVLGYEDVELDYKTVEEYKKKLKTKNKVYNGGIIILGDFESPTEIGAFSRTSPLSHYLLVVYSGNVNLTDTYSHEIGHMLGLPHLFFKDKEKEAYKNAKESISGNGTIAKQGIVKIISDINRSTSPFYGSSGMTAIKEDIIKYIEIYNDIYLKEIEKDKQKILYINTMFVNYKDSDKISTNQTKKEQLDILNNGIKIHKNNISENKIALVELKKRLGNNYERIELPMTFLRQDLITLFKQNLVYSKNIIEQIHSNYLLFKQNTTKNFMDYYNDRQFYGHHQIKIMRSDIQNYLDIPCNCNKSKSKKK